MYIYIYIYVCVYLYTYDYHTFGKNNWYCTGGESKHSCFVQAALFGLKPILNDGILCVDTAIQQHFAVGVRKGSFIIETL